MTNMGAPAWPFAIRSPASDKPLVGNEVAVQLADK